LDTVPQRDYGDDIRGRLPENSELQVDGNPGRIMIDECIGKYFGDMEVGIFVNSRARFLPNATGPQLEMYGDWFGIKRNGMDDDIYRAQITSLISADITVAGIKRAISAILDIDISEISISNNYPNYCRAGAPCNANLFSGNPCTFAGHFSMVNKTMTITVPSGTDITNLGSVIDNLIIPGVTVNYLED